MRPVRVTTVGAGPSLPLRMNRSGQRRVGGRHALGRQRRALGAANVPDVRDPRERHHLDVEDLPQQLRHAPRREGNGARRSGGGRSRARSTCRATFIPNLLQQQQNFGEGSATS
jgi:hypothetical protein